VDRRDEAPRTLAGGDERGESEVALPFIGGSRRRGIRRNEQDSAQNREDRAGAQIASSAAVGGGRAIAAGTREAGEVRGPREAFATRRA